MTTLKIELKQTYSNPSTGAQTLAIKNGIEIINAYLQSKGKTLSNIRSHRINKNGLHTFKCGIGYDIISKDLLDAPADGKAEADFKEWVKNNTEYDWVNFILV